MGLINELKYSNCNKNRCGYKIANCPVKKILSKHHPTINWCPYCDGEVYDYTEKRMGKIVKKVPVIRGGWIHIIGSHGQNLMKNFGFACSCEAGTVRREAGASSYNFADDAQYCFRYRDLKNLKVMTDQVKDRPSVHRYGAWLKEKINELGLQAELEKAFSILG
jgi:hypothetical protein